MWISILARLDIYPEVSSQNIVCTVEKVLGEVFRKLAEQKESRIEEEHLLPDRAHMLIAMSQVIGCIK